MGAAPCAPACSPTERVRRRLTGPQASINDKEIHPVQHIGFIGLGAMGRAMARNIHRHGYTLGVYNRSAAPAEAFRELGVPVFGAASELAAASDTVVIMVTDPVALNSVLHGENGVLEGLRAGTCVINMSTVSHAATVEAAQAVGAHGGRFIDAPVSGTVKPAEEGTLVILAGGETRDIDAAEPLLKTMCKTVVRCGPVGQATRMKLVLNLMLAGMMQSLAEALALGEAVELDPQQILSAIGAGPLGAALYAMKGAMMLQGEFTKQFPVDLLAKDTGLVLEAAASKGLALPLTAAVNATLAAAHAQGYGDEDMAALYKVIKRA